MRAHGAAGGALPTRCVKLAWRTLGARMRLIRAPSTCDAACCPLTQLEGAQAATLAARRAVARLKRSRAATVAARRARS
eukprot:751100-Prymnesium_polylepis.1